MIYLADTWTDNQWEYQDPKMEVLYKIVGHILWGYSLKLRPETLAVYIIGTSTIYIYIYTHIYCIVFTIHNRLY